MGLNSEGTSWFFSPNLWFVMNSELRFIMFFIYIYNIYVDFIVMPIIAMHVVELIRNLKVKWGMVEEDWYARVMEPVVSYLRSFALVARSEYFTQHPKLLETWQDGMVMTVAVLRWLIFCLPSWDSILYLVGLDNKGPACRSGCSIAPMGGFFVFSKETYLTMTLQFISWVLSLVLFLAIVFIFTELLKFVQRVTWSWIWLIGDWEGVS